MHHWLGAKELIVTTAFSYGSGTQNAAKRQRGNAVANHHGLSRGKVAWVGSDSPHRRLTNLK